MRLMLRSLRAETDAGGPPALDQQFRDMRAGADVQVGTVSDPADEGRGRRTLAIGDVDVKGGATVLGLAIIVVRRAAAGLSDSSRKACSRGDGGSAVRDIGPRRRAIHSRRGGFHRPEMRQHIIIAPAVPRRLPSRQNPRGGRARTPRSARMTRR